VENSYTLTLSAFSQGSNPRKTQRHSLTQTLFNRKERGKFTMKQNMKTSEIVSESGFSLMEIAIGVVAPAIAFTRFA